MRVRIRLDGGVIVKRGIVEICAGLDYFRFLGFCANGSVEFFVFGSGFFSGG